ncbi:hypothetical protein [Amycolatopsis alkalitolerans]|uniref:Uncharacterized protein n=1 Tax=Amycolatopsis alkalitolerans TaxID=2547244 RepID=A0A5C4LS35_9PSEU|nr:hypothetical protein [Amycolatopsis alkalitolerans]TNC19068.1 hypothetical protein FG385_32905 [Amycolatopsis alkalitolerans]
MAAQTAAPQGAPAGAPPAQQGGGNPFWEVTNLFAQKNKQGAVSSLTLDASTHDGGGQINAGNFLRGLRLIVRSSGGAGGTVAADAPLNLFKRLGIENTDGAEILYNVIGGYAYGQRQRYMRPWLQDPTTAFDYSATVNPSFTLFLQPEVRQQLGVLENTDVRSQYAWNQTIETVGNVLGAPTTAPAVSVTPYCDMWAQPDQQDLEGVPNQRIPAGANLQTKTRHQTFTLNAAGSDNNFLSTMTGNAVRCAILIVRDSTGARQDYLSDPIQWQLDSRNLGTLSPDVVFQWMQDHYSSYGGRSRPTGVYVFPRFYSPGVMYGQGWLYTANSTSLYWESSTLSTGANLPGTVELLQEEVYAVGPVDPSLIDL